MPRYIYRHTRSKGFTLIEISIVLVALGLLVGGVLVGRDLIATAEINSFISQIDKFNAAATTFHNKYGYLPGDIPDPNASNAGFDARGSGLNGPAGTGDGNGLIESYTHPVDPFTFGPGSGTSQHGEILTFWADLTKAGLIEGNYKGTPTFEPTSTGSGVNVYLPLAKVGSGADISIISAEGIHYFFIANYVSLGTTQQSTWILAPRQLYGIDKKMDDGLPETGIVQPNTLFLNAGNPVNSHTCYYTGATPPVYALDAISANNPNCMFNIQATF